MGAMPTVSLESPVSVLPGVGPKRVITLEEAGIHTLQDLLLYLPFRYIDASQITPIAHLQSNLTVTIQASVVKHQPLPRRGPRSIILTTIADDTGQLTISFFNQRYVLHNLQVGESYAFTGTVKEFRGKLSLANPTYESLNKEVSIHTGRIIPVYRQTKDLSVRWLRQLLHIALMRANLRLPEYLPESILKQQGLMSRQEALLFVHFPENFQQAKLARRRLAFDELWELFEAIQQQDEERKRLAAVASVAIRDLDQDISDFENLLPFPLSPTQKIACKNIAQDLAQSYPTQHVVQGEVGSGKTFVAAFGLLRVAKSGRQAFYLAPTTILAQQHYEVIAPLAQSMNVKCELWTRTQKQNDQANIIIGTHAILHHATFTPGLVISDEEHRFGVAQRQHFWTQDPRPHLISMSATPIPRTLATILFSNQTTSNLDIIPGKQKNTLTRTFPIRKLSDHFSWLANQVSTGEKQAFLIAPFIHPSENDDFSKVFDAHSLFELAQKSMPQTKIALLTGENSDGEKNRILESMKNGEIDVLVATPVIEVGIDLPKAAIITITSAERFGLAQLHQLRGRVGRQGQESWCFLVPSAGASQERLKQLESIHDGRELAELDLALRGAGEFLGTRQSGWDTLEIASWFDLELLQQVQKVRRELA